MSEVQIVMAATNAEWASRLTEWITDHGADARLRDTYVFTRSDALGQEFDCLVGEADSSLLEVALITELHRRGQTVVGVCDPRLPRTRARLEQLGVDGIVETTATSQEMLDAILEVTRTRRDFDAVVGGFDDFRSVGVLPDRAADDVPQPASWESVSVESGSGEPPSTMPTCLTVVTGPTEGLGASEVAIEIALQLRRRGEAVVLVDADLVAPCLAQRLRAPLLPNLNTAVDAVAHRTGTVLAALTPVPSAGFDLLAGLEHPKNWPDFTPDDILDVLEELRLLRPHVVVNVGSQLEELPSGRHALARALVARADRIVVVAEPSPVGLQRLSRWLVDVDGLAGTDGVHVAFNRSRFRDARNQVDRELLRLCSVAGITHIPSDPRLSRAAWACEPVRPGPFTKSVAGLVATAIPHTTRRARNRGFLRLRKARR